MTDLSSKSHDHGINNYQCRDQREVTFLHCGPIFMTRLLPFLLSYSLSNLFSVVWCAVMYMIFDTKVAGSILAVSVVFCILIHKDFQLVKWRNSKVIWFLAIVIYVISVIWNFNTFICKTRSIPKKSILQSIFLPTKGGAYTEKKNKIMH